MDKKEISKKIKEYLKAARVLQVKRIPVAVSMPLVSMARLLGISAPALSYKLQHHSWSIEEVQRITKLLNIPIGELIGENTAPKAQEQGENNGNNGNNSISNNDNDTDTVANTRINTCGDI